MKKFKVYRSQRDLLNPLEGILDDEVYDLYYRQHWFLRDGKAMSILCCEFGDITFHLHQVGINRIRCPRIRTVNGNWLDCRAINLFVLPRYEEFAYRKIKRRPKEAFEHEIRVIRIASLHLLHQNQPDPEIPVFLEALPSDLLAEARLKLERGELDG